MSDSQVGQQSLKQFVSADSNGASTGNTDTNTDSSTERTPPTSTSETQSKPKSRSKSRTTLLDELYEEVRDYAYGGRAQKTYPDELWKLEAALPLKPPTKLHTTRHLPDGVEALPLEIGDWTLEAWTDTNVVYVSRGDAYDHRWGDGGALHAVEVYLNNSGANRDDKYHIREQTKVGFENASQVREATIDTRDDLYGIRGFSPSNNDGDHGMSTGTKSKTGTAAEGVYELLAHLHNFPSPFGKHLTIVPDTGWELQKLSPRGATYRAEAPAAFDKTYLRLSIHCDTLIFRAYDENDSLPDRHSLQIPPLDTVPAPYYERNEGSSRTPFVQPVAALAGMNELLTKPPEAFDRSLLAEG